MPRVSRGPYLKLRKREGAQALWYIIDGDKRTATGHDAEDADGARQALTDYLSNDVTRSDFKQQAPGSFFVAEAVILYATDCVPTQRRPDEAGMRLTRIVEFFGEMSCDQITPSTTSAYVRWRTHSGNPGKGEPPRVRKAVKDVSARRELEDLRAALRHAWKSRKISVEIPVTLPPKSQPRERWLTESEASRLLLGAFGFVLASCSDVTTKQEQWKIWRREPMVTSRHLVRFILIGLRTGTRHDAILAMGWEQHDKGGFFDLEHRLMFRAEAGARQTKKRRTPAPIPDNLLRHLPRWKRLADGPFVISHASTHGERLLRIHGAFRRAVERAGLGPEVTPHILRHTCVTWLMQRGRPIWEVAGFTGMTAEMVEQNYGHHAPQHLRDTANA